MNRKILIVDDERSIRVSLEHFLVHEGYAVTTAGTCEDALAALKEKSFDLVIADIVLGEKSGIDVLREVKRKKQYCPVVMITGAPELSTATEALRIGAFDYISKPVRKDDLMHVTRIALQHKRLHDEKETYRLHLESIFKNINDGIVTVGLDCIVTEINEAAQELCGFSPDQKGKLLCGEPVSCNGKCSEILRDSLVSRKDITIDRHECARNDGPSRVVSITASPLPGNDGVVTGAMLVIRDETRIDSLERGMIDRHQLHHIIGRSEKMQNIYSLIENLADVRSTVLITGESGTGKELVAEALHYKGNRRDRPLVKVNCSALQENLLESELFGHVRGAFTGAIENKDGRFFKADGGTIFLDEIGDISERIQLKLLRVLQEREFERVGDATPIRTNVRIIAATNKDLRKKIRSGEFREDLFYRLKVLELELPSLRDNREDIPLLVEHFLNIFNESLNRSIDAVSTEVMQVFMVYPWPGNVRELEHAIEHAFVTCRDITITMDHLPIDIKSFHAVDSYSVKAREYQYPEELVKALNKSGWNISKAARILGISRPTVYRKMKEFDIRDS